jgi:hypothetical protein
MSFTKKLGFPLLTTALVSVGGSSAAVEPRKVEFDEVSSAKVEQPPSIAEIGGTELVLHQPGWFREDEEAFQALVRKLALGEINPAEKVLLKSLRERRVENLAPRPLIDIVREREEREVVNGVALALARYYDYVNKHIQSGSRNKKDSNSSVR